jgi:aminopeptidase N
MDEGFTSYASAIIMSEVSGPPGANVHGGSYRGYFGIVKSGLEEPLTTHADHFNTNAAYGAAAYSKGAVYLHQLGYVIGEPALQRGMKRYYNTWKFKHPNTDDFLRIMEKESGLVLDWYNEYFVQTTKTIDYAIDTVKTENGGTSIELKRLGKMIMPIDLTVEFQDGTKRLYYIPLDLMRGDKPNENPAVERVVLSDWTWTHPTYRIRLTVPASTIKKIELDASSRMADLDRSNNIYPASNGN